MWESNAPIEQLAERDNARVKAWLGTQPDIERVM
jgi:hypothetical protein